ncbi:MAG: hypothetical protein C0418_04195 [Coriobacteriaceae bacterium]|nr:hypothetical protein [Coriobacteriaceae bacterium]
MTRKFRPLTPQLLRRVPDMCVGCVFWESGSRLEARCGSEQDLARAVAWAEHVTAEWGEPGRAALEEGEVLGIVKYAPARYFPQARNMPAGPPSDDAVLLACMHIVPEARQHGLGKLLLHAALRDLVGRGERSVEAYGVASQPDYATSPLVGVEFLLRSGFTVLRPHPDMPLMRLDLRTLAVLRGDLETMLDALRIPLGAPARAPAHFEASPAVRNLGRT